MIEYMFRNSGEDSMAGQEIRLMVPPAEVYNYNRKQHIYQNKDYFWTKIRPVVQYLAGCPSVEWEGDDKLVTIAENATDILLKKKSAAGKDSMVDFYFMFFGQGFNILSYLDGTITRKGFEIGKEIIESGALALEKIPGMMGWPPYKAKFSGDNIDSGTLGRWRESDDTAPLGIITSIGRGPGENRKSQNYYYSRPYPYIIPMPRMIGYFINKEEPHLDIVVAPGKDDGAFVEFKGFDFLSNEPMLQNLIVSGVVAPTKTKIGVNTVKRINSYVKTEPFPQNASVIMSRGEYLANLCFLVFGEPGAFNIPKKAVPAEDYLRSVYDNVKIKCKYYLGLILGDRVKGLPYEFYYLNKSRLLSMFQCVEEVLKSSFNISVDGWCRYRSFCMRVNSHLARRGVGYIYPSEVSERPEGITDGAGVPMPMSEFKSNFHDLFLRSMIEGLAAIGGVDLYFDNSGNISFLRLTEIGKWYMGLKKELPSPENGISVEDAISVDDRTGLILIKNPDYPYLSLLADFAEKMTDTRYCISGRSFIKDCTSPSELDAKIKKFRSFILPAPGPHISGMLEKLRDQCNLVKRSPGGSTYVLYDIDPSNSRLHNLIMDDPDIRSNVLRVEGCRLLIKSRYIDTFFEKLTAGGFLNDIK